MKISSSKLVRSVLFAALSAAGSVAFAAEDFSTLSNEELIQRRSEARNMSEEDRVRLRNEMQRRAQKMTSEEREQLGVGRGDDQEGRARQHSETPAGDYGRGYEARHGGGHGAGMSGGR